MFDGNKKLISKLTCKGPSPDAIKYGYKQPHPYVDSWDYVCKQPKSFRHFLENEKNDCVVRALSAVTLSAYDVAHEFTSEYMFRNHGEGVENTMGKLVKCASNNFFQNKFEETFDHKISEIIVAGKSQTYAKHITKQGVLNVVVENNHRYTRKNTSPSIDSFIESHPEGSWFILFRGHAAAVVDGVLIDNFEFRYEGWRRPIVSAFKMEKLWK